MDKQQLIRSMTTQYGDFLMVGEVAEYLRIDRGTARNLLVGLPFLPVGRKKLFSVVDIATRIKEREQI